MKDVAQAAAVDVSTASRALRDDPKVAPATRDRVHAAAQRLGYRVNLAARALRHGSTRTVWFLTGSTDAENERLLAAEAGRMLEAGGYDLLLAGHRNDPAAYDRLLGRLQQGIADAALLVAPTGTHHDSAVLRALLAQRHPLLFLDRSPGWAEVPTVTSANREAARELVRRLVAAGSRRLVYCDIAPNDVAIARRDGALAEATALGLPACLAADADAAWIAAAGGPIAAMSNQQSGIHQWCTRWAEALHGAELRFACWDTWTGEPYPAPLAIVAVQDFPGMARRGAERLLAILADPTSWNGGTEFIPALRFDEVRARL